MVEATNALLLAAGALIYFAALAALFRLRGPLGLGAFFCALGVMHFIETYLAASLYVALPLGIVASPGSVVLFSGKLMLLLLVYIREDAAVVRQPIYGLLLGNLLIVALAFILRLHVAVPAMPGQAPDLAFVNQMGALMVWGTALLFVDCILIILLYERARTFLGGRVVPRLWLSASAVLTFDQIGFFAGLYVLVGADVSVMIGGWTAKMAAAAFYALLGGAYLYWVERREIVREASPRIADVFSILTYRERYEALLERTGRDALTGVLDRGQLEIEGPRLVRQALEAGNELTLFVVDIDRFKDLNDRFGHPAGDLVLRLIAGRIATSVRATDRVFRYGGEEFVVLCEGLNAGTAEALGEHLRRTIETADLGAVDGVTASIGIATCPGAAHDYGGLFAVADERLYQAKASGRNRVVGAEPREPGEPAHAHAVSPAA